MPLPARPGVPLVFLSPHPLHLPLEDLPRRRLREPVHHHDAAQVHVHAAAEAHLVQVLNVVGVQVEQPSKEAPAMTLTP